MKTVSLAYSTREINRNFRIKVSGLLPGYGVSRQRKQSNGGRLFIGLKSFSIEKAMFFLRDNICFLVENSV